MTTPVPALPADPAELTCQCADLWSHPAAQLLIGDALRPGGRDLTDRLLAVAGVGPGTVVLDVGCGPGTTAEAAAAAGAVAVALDYSAAHATDAAGRPGVVAVRADGTRLPVADRSVDVVVCECVLSTFVDKPAAVVELARVLRPGGRLVLSDVTVSGPLPEPLASAIGWAACAAGALAPDGYRRLLETVGTVTAVVHADAEMAAMVAKARRRFALLRAAAAVGVVPPLEELVGPELTAVARTLLGHHDLGAGGRELLATVAGEVASGRLGYRAFIATVPA